MEKWRRVPGFINYSVSSNGNFRREGGTTKCKETREVKQMTHRGYKYVSFSKNGKVTKGLAHRIVLAAFKGAAPKGLNQCNHIDGNKSNNKRA